MPHRSPRHAAWLALGLVVLTVVVYAPVRGFAFVNYDDNVYIAANPHVAKGLTADNVIWSLSAFENGNWHPLALISHMIDVQAFGLASAGHHEVNLALHLANVLLLFWLLSAATQELGASALVAALFAVHPLNVETVAWVSERKSLLSTAFWLGALILHVSERRDPSPKKALGIVALAACALASKPMAVTLPLTIILLDLWPLDDEPAGEGSLIARYGRELAPVLALCALCGVLALYAQRSASALQTVADYTWSVRLGNAAVASTWYLQKLIWPSSLAVFYPHPMGTQAALPIALSLAVFAALCVLVWIRRRALPEALTGWGWYVGTLLPVIGIVQVGSQAYADRYAYVPLMGIFVIIVFAGARSIAHRPASFRQAATVLGVAWIAALAFVTRAQLPYWKDSVSLFGRAVDVVPDNALAHNNLGMALIERRQLPQALEHFQKAVDIAPWDTDARSNLGNALRASGKPAEAVAQYEKALEQNPNDATIYYNLATALTDLNRVDEAVRRLLDAVRLDPDYSKARYLLAVDLYRKGRPDDALTQFRELERRDPNDKRATDAIRMIESGGKN
jgi:tetratricopeptide (TPR) repeat protein